jgi:polyadenylate-binding protein 2
LFIALNSVLQQHVCYRFAYVEFSDTEAVNTAVALDESLFRGRQIKVVPKRTNKPGISSTNRPPRGRGRGRGLGFRGRGRAMFRARRRPFFAPY